MSFDYITLSEAEELTGLPGPLLKALCECGEVPSEMRGADVHIGKHALLSWCQLYGQILSAIVARQPRRHLGTSLFARNLVWMSQAGMLAGKDRVRL